MLKYDESEEFTMTLPLSGGRGQLAVRDMIRRQLEFNLERERGPGKLSGETWPL